MAIFPVVLDACVLYPITLTDFWLRCELAGLCRVHWSPEILDEIRRNLAPDLGASAIDRRLAQMERAFPTASVAPPPSLVNAMTNDPKDRHVLAAAVHTGAGVVVTDNVRDFPESACRPHNVEIQTAAQFAEHLANLSPSTVANVIRTMAASRTNPQRTTEEMANQLRRSGLTRAVDIASPHFTKLR